jgi:hypothetical protein
MEDPVADAILNQYFRRLEQALSLLPAERREQIVEDLRAHIEDALRSEPDRSEASVLAVLDRVGDPDEIAQEALSDAADGGDVGTPAGGRAGLGTASGNSASTEPSKAGLRPRLLASVAVVLAVVVLAILTLTGGFSAAAPSRTATDPVGGGAPIAKNGWLASVAVSGGGGVDSFRCSPQTVTGSESTAELEGDATRVGSGSIGGHSWSVWSKTGVKGGAGLEEGGVVIDGVAHGLCAGFPNPAEMELLDPSGGGDAIAYGVVGYPGAAKVDIYTSTVGTFDDDKLVGSTTSRVANGVGFFITPLAQSGCELSALELNTASASYATEHNLGFATKHCSAGQLVPISDSQGIWELPPKDFPNHYGAGGGNSLPGGGLIAPRLRLARIGSISSCSRPTDAATSGSVANSVAGASEVASGTIDDQRWTLWSKNGDTGSAALEDAGVILDGHAYGLCPGFPNPAELELIDPSSGRSGIVIGVSGYNGAATAKVFAGTPNTFNTGTLLYSGHTVSADGTDFFIGQLSKSACDYSSLELNVKAGSSASQHNLEFGFCHPGKLVTITGSMGEWSASG